MCFFTLCWLNDRIPVLFLTHKLANRCMLSRTNKGEVLCSAPPIGWFNWLIVNCPQGSKYKNTHSHEHQQSEKEEEKESLINFVLNGYTWENTVTTKPPAFSLQQLLRQCSLDSLEEEMLGKFFHNVVILSRVFLFFYFSPLYFTWGWLELFSWRLLSSVQTSHGIRVYLFGRPSNLQPTSELNLKSPLGP